jgi:hypothetical protein
MTNHSWMRSTGKIAFTRRVEAGDECGERVADAHALEIRQADESMLPKVATVPTRAANHRDKRGRSIFDRRRQSIARTDSGRSSDSDDA